MGRAMLSTSRKLWIAGLLALVGLVTLLEWRSHWRHIASDCAPKKTPQISNTPLAQQAQAFFWREFHAGHYEQIPEILRLLTAAYLEQPRDPKLPLLLAHSHLWKLSERARTDGRDPRITEHAILAEKYFHIPPNYVVEDTTTHRNPPEVRICRLRNQSAVGNRPP